MAPREFWNVSNIHPTCIVLDNDVEVRRFSLFAQLAHVSHSITVRVAGEWVGNEFPEATP